MRRLNIRLLIILVVVVVSAGGLIQALHAFQVRRHSGAYLREADRAEQAGKPLQAVDYLRKYLLLAPDDTRELARLGKLLLDQHQYLEAKSTLGQVIQRDPSNDSVRQQLVDISLRLRRFEDAKAQLDNSLLASHPDDGKLLYQLGVCFEGTGKDLEAAVVYAIALQKKPDQVVAYDRLAQVIAKHPEIVASMSQVIAKPATNGKEASFLQESRYALEKPTSESSRADLKPFLESLRDPNKPSAALTVLDLMVERNPKSVEAHIYRGRFLQQHAGDPGVQRAALHDGSADRVRKLQQEAFDEAKRALDLSPTDIGALLFASEAALANGSVQEARGFAERALKEDPKSTASYLVLASLAIREKQTNDAVDILTRGIKATGEAPVLLWTLADLQIALNNVAKAQPLIDRLRNLPEAHPIVQYFNGRILINDSKWADAKKQLEEAATDLKRFPDLHREAEFWLAQCYARLGLQDLSVGAYRAALEDDHNWVAARLGLAETLRSLGRLDEAALELHGLSQLRDAPPQTSMAELQVAVLQKLAKPASDQDWKNIENEIARVAPTADTTLLAAEVCVAQSEQHKEKMEEGRRILTAGMSSFPKEARLWAALVSLESQQAGWNTVEKVLRDMHERFGDVVSYRIAKAEYLARRYGTARKDELTAIASPPAAYSANDRLALAVGITRWAIALEDYDLAKSLLQSIAAAEPANIQVRLLLFDIAWQTGRAETMETALKEVRQIEQDGALSHYGEALRLALVGKQKNDTALLEQAIARLAEARTRRANWAKTAWLAGEIYDFRGRHGGGDTDLDKAADNFVEAIELGERDPRVVSRVLQLLTNRNDYARSELILRRLHDEKLPFSTELTRWEADLEFRKGNHETSLKTRQKLAKKTNGVRDLLSLADAYLVEGKEAEAERAYREATERDPKDPNAWIGLVRFYATTGKKIAAEKARADAERNLKGVKNPMATVYLDELIGRTNEAESVYEQAIREAPHDELLQRRQIELLLNHGKSGEAEPKLRAIVEAKPAPKDPTMRPWARQELAKILASHGTWAPYEEARSLIEENLKQTPESTRDRLLKALILTSQPTAENKKLAIAEFESLSKRPGTLSPDNLILLAQLYLAGKDWDKASPVLLDIASQTKDPKQLTFCIEQLLNHNEYALAENWLRKLEALPKSEVATATFGADLLFRQNDRQKAFDRIEKFVGDIKDTDDPATRATQLRAAAAQFERLGDRLRSQKQPDEAKRFYTEAEACLKRANAAAKTPSTEYLEFLVRRRRDAEAIAEFERLRDKVGDVQLTRMTAALLAISFQTEDRATLERIASLIAQATEKRPDAAALSTLATSQDRMGDYDAAEASYRRAISLDGKRIDALNNLAYLLALRKKNLPEAHALIERAIAQAGPKGPLLDTRAIALLAAGQPAAALADVDNAVHETPSPVHYFHQARAYLGEGKREAAQASLDQARKLGLNLKSLHPLEAPTLEQLESQLRSASH